MTKHKTAEYVTVDRLKELYSYEPETGHLLWRSRASVRAVKVKIGAVAGCFTHGYYTVRTAGMGSIPGAVVVWALHHGEYPTARLRYRDGDRTNTRIENLELRGIAGKVFDLRTKEGSLAYGKAYREANPDQTKGYHLSKKFGITVAEFAAMAVAQGNKCAICECAETAISRGKVKALSVDHDHETGAIRDLLCDACNRGLGAFKDNPDSLVKAARYLRRHRGEDNIASLRVVKSE